MTRILLFALIILLNVLNSLFLIPKYIRFLKHFKIHSQITCVLKLTFIHIQVLYIQNLNLIYFAILFNLI